MKYLNEYRDADLIKKLSAELSAIPSPNKRITLMEVCGTHTMAIARFGLRQLLPEWLRLVSGPGCPVCVTPNAYLDRVLAIGQLPGVILTTFGDMLRVPGSYSSLEKEKARGRDVRVVYSPLDAVALAEKNPGKEVVFLGVGFETTAPTIAGSILQARKRGVENYSVLCAHKTMPGPMEVLAAGEEVEIDGFICPAHVSAIIGSESYRFLAEKYGKACVVTGFEPVDILQGILMLVRQIQAGKPTVENQYKRVVHPRGNRQAQAILERVFEPCDAEWRGIGMIPGSGLQLRKEFVKYDAGVMFSVEVPPTRENPGCICGKVMKGVAEPTDCRLFGKACTPENPVGACMVSSEGTCAAAYRYRPIK
ncbi:MAG: hydrogenase formation protein HypD [Calditrichia bacterium]